MVRTLTSRQGTSLLSQVTGLWPVSPSNGTLFDAASRSSYNRALSACMGPPRVPGSWAFRPFASDRQDEI